MAKRQQQQQSRRQKKTNATEIATAKKLDEKRSLVEKNKNPCVVFVLYDFSSSHHISFLSAVTTVFFLSALLFADARLLLLLLLPCSRRSFRVGFEKTGS